MSAPLGSEQARALAAGTVPDGIVVALGAVAVPDPPAPVVRFATRREAPGELLIATAGEGLWRRGPWPAADALFDLPEPGPRAAVLALGSEATGLAERLEARGVDVLVRTDLALADLEQVAAVAFTGDGSFPAQAFAVAAAARVLLLSAPEPLFGLQDGIDCFRFGHVDEAATVAEAAVRSPAAFAAVGRLARIAAEPHRASRVYARLAVDVALGVGRVGEARNERSASST